MVIGKTIIDDRSDSWLKLVCITNGVKSPEKREAALINLWVISYKVTPYFCNDIQSVFVDWNRHDLKNFSMMVTE